MQLTIAWWNTALSPSKRRDRASPEEKLVACEVVRMLTEELGVDLILLAEVSEADIDAIESAGVTVGYRTVRAMNPAGRGYFDVCVLHKANALEVSDPTDILLEIDARTSRIAQRFDVVVASASQPLHVFASHWPSPATIGKFDPDRWRLGDRLRSPVDDILKADANANVILVGDYNDEPFDYSVSLYLRASRDAEFVVDRPTLLYNPFWRHLSSFDHGAPEPLTDRGTYLHQGGTVTRWRTFDHMMFSSSFLRSSGGWTLDEHRTRVLDFPGFTELVVNRTHVFDHLPILGRIYRSSTP